MKVTYGFNKKGSYEINELEGKEESAFKLKDKSLKLERRY